MIGQEEKQIFTYDNVEVISNTSIKDFGTVISQEENLSNDDSKVTIEIDIGVYFEVNDFKIEDELYALEEELIQSGKKPYLLARIIDNPGIFIWILGAFASIGGFLFGLDQSLISGASLYIPNALNISSSDMAMITGFTPLGAIFGAMNIIPTNELFGRKWAIIISAILCNVGTIMEAAAESFGVLLVGRIILGVSLGILSGTVPAYIAENSVSKWRGGLVSLYQCMVAFGVMCGYFVAAIFNNVSGNWRWTLGSSVVFSTMLLIGMFSLPESTRLLMRRGQKLDSYLVWKHARGFNSIEEKREFFVMERVVLYEKERNEDRMVFWDLLTKPRCYRPMIISIIFQLGAQQMSGVNSIQYFQASLLERAGLSRENAVYTSSVGGAAMFLATIPAILLIDRLGRRTLTLTFIPGVCIALLITGCSFLINDLGTRLGVYFLGMILFNIFWSVALGPGPWVFASEAYPTYLRSYGVSIAAICSWTGTFITTYPFQKMSDTMSSTGVFSGFYCGMVILSGIFLLLFMPETKNLTLEQINSVFQRSVQETVSINLRNTKQVWNNLLRFRFKQVWKLS